MAEVNSVQEGDLTFPRSQATSGSIIRTQGLVCVMALVGLAAFVNFPNAYVACGCVIAIITVIWISENKETGRLPICKKAVLITGCDTGFGHYLAKQLASLGVTVFAGCLQSSGEGAAALRKFDNPRLLVVQMDVTKQKEIDDVLEEVNEVTDGHGLWGVVNNAGLNFMGDVELTTMEQFERVANINQLGMIRVTKTFLPLVRKTRGRIVNVTSVKGRVSTIFDAAYSPTKFAGEAFSDILRMEMSKFGVDVVIIEPCNFGGATGCLEPVRLRKDFETMWENLSPELKETYGKDYVFHHLKNAEAGVPTACRDLSRVTNKIVEALFAIKPKTRYLIGGSSSLYDSYKLRALLYPVVPSWFMDRLFLKDIKGFPLPQVLKEKAKSD